MESDSVDHLAIIRIIDIDGIPESQLTPLLSLLSDSELARYQRLARDRRKRQFLLGRLLLRYSLAQLCGVEVRDITLAEQERQAPIVHIAGITTPPGFSISHSANWVACACSESVRLGMDIEQKNAQRNLAEIAAHSFPADEVSWIANQPDGVAAFYKTWSAKEARFKLNQNYTKADVEYCYEFPHAALSVVLMTGQRLSAVPEYVPITWTELHNFFAEVGN